MASIKKRGKNYLIIVSRGYDSQHKKIPPATITWRPDPTWRQDRIDKELVKAANDFENKVKNGHYLDGEKITFEEFAETWLRDHAEKQLKPKTIDWYKKMLDTRINKAIGHIKLAKLQPSHLIKFMNQLQDPGSNQNQKYKAKDGIRDVWKASGKKANKDFDRRTLTEVLTQRNVNFASAEKFAKLMEKKIKDLFDPVGDPQALSAVTVGHHLRCVSTIMSKAVEWQVVESNPCERVRAPKSDQKPIKFMEIDTAQDIIKAALELKDIQLQTIILLFLYAGIRRAELSGLQWPDIDLDKGTITIKRTVQQLPHRGYVEGEPKTASGVRMISISSDLIVQMRAFRTWYLQERLKAGDQWQGKEREQAKGSGQDFQPVEWMITTWNGYPLSPTTVYHRVKQFLIDNGQGEMTVHALRHSNISLLLSQGVDLITASRRAGHAKPSTTANIYAHALRRPDEDAADKLNDLLKPSKKTAN
jgi:integrase